MNAGLPAKQTGIAVLTAILVVAIATVLAVNLLWQASVNLRRTETLLLQDQARQYDLAGEDLAKYWLAEDIRETGNEGIDTPEDDWATPILSDIEGGTIRGRVEDLQGRFNLNGLIGADGKPVAEIADQYQRLLLLLPLEPPLDPGTARLLTEATIDWIDPDQIPGLEGAEDDRYTSRLPPYRPANFWFTSTSELLAIEGYTATIYRELQRYVSALPPPSGTGEALKLNVNTAEAIVLASLQKDLLPGDVEGFVNQGYKSVSEFTEAFSEGQEPLPHKIALDVKSSWFLVTATASIGSVESTMYSLLERRGGDVRTRLRTYDVN